MISWYFVNENGIRPASNHLQNATLGDSGKSGDAAGVRGAHAHLEQLELANYTDR